MGRRVSCYRCRRRVVLRVSFTFIFQTMNHRTPLLFLCCSFFPVNQLFSLRFPVCFQHYSCWKRPPHPMIPDLIDFQEQLEHIEQVDPSPGPFFSSSAGHTGRPATRSASSRDRP